MARSLIMALCKIKDSNFLNFSILSCAENNKKALNNSHWILQNFWFKMYSKCLISTFIIKKCPGLCYKTTIYSFTPLIILKFSWFIVWIQSCNNSFFCLRVLVHFSVVNHYHFFLLSTFSFIVHSLWCMIIKLRSINQGYYFLGFPI